MILFQKFAYALSPKMIVAIEDDGPIIIYGIFESTVAKSLIGFWITVAA